MCYIFDRPIDVTTIIIQMTVKSMNVAIFSMHLHVVIL